MAATSLSGSTTKLVREKKAQGYTEGEDGTPYQNTDIADEVSGIQCQLLNPIEEQELADFINSPEYCGQEKFDGRRTLIQKTGPLVSGINRKGLWVGLPLPLVVSGEAIPGEFIMDGESIGEVLYAFDLLMLNGEDLKPKPYRERYLALMNLLASAQQQHIQLVPTAFTGQQKQSMLSDLRQQNKEGIVFKRLDAPYIAGRPSSGGSQLKHKFYATLSAVIMHVNGQRSVGVGLWNGKDWQRAGNVTIPANKEIPNVGAILELRYLYAFRESGCLYQPTYLGERSDIDPEDCSVAQLKFKSATDEDRDEN